MNICGEKKEVSPLLPFVVGNLYEKIKGDRMHALGIYCYSQPGFQMTKLDSGTYWNIPTRSEWADVTDQYCLQKVGA